MLPIRSRRRFRGALALAAALAMLAGACGSDGDDDEAATEGGDAESAAETTTTTGADEEAADDAAADGDAEESGDGEVAQIRWFVGLGTGAQPEQIDVQDEVVAAFNDAHDDIELTVEYVDNEVAADTLATQIASGNAPDIIGPVGIRGSNEFAGQFLDLEPLIESSGFDLSMFGDEQVEVWREDDGALTAVPFGAYPSFIYYNTELFDEAGLPYPPHTVGEDYDGEPWTMEKLQEIATFLTVDANGNDATSAEFDAGNIVQFGFNHQWGDDARAQGSFFGAGTFVADDGTAQIPDVWLDEWNWYHDMIWDVGAAPTQAYLDSELLNGDNTFTTGNMAMVFSHIWYTCCIRNDDNTGKTFWDIAVVPTYEGNTTSKLHADVFRILDSTEHPEAAFEVMSYLVDEAAGDLLNTYGSMPAREDIQDAFFAGLDETFPQGVDWDVAREMLDYPDVPSHESDMPNFLEAEARIDQFESLIASEASMDVDAEAESLRADLDEIFAAGSS
ncbi:MAG: extracellular solute-binding protein [Actinomycetota bacterium]|nr:extracellular solute-binding protein [Actinomycetota bacterium]